MPNHNSPGLVSPKTNCSLRSFRSWGRAGLVAAAFTCALACSSGGGAPGGSGGATGSRGGGGATSCTGRALSVCSNGTSSDSDAAYARVVIDLMTALPVGNANRTVEFWAYIKSTDWVGDKNEIYYYGTSGT